MKTAAVLLLASVLVGGCVDKTILMETPYGARGQCRAAGWGYVGTPRALHLQRECVKNFARRGYQDVTKPNITPAQLVDEMVRQEEEALRPNERPKD